MKKKTPILLGLNLLLWSSLGLAKVIVLDAGHTPENSGAMGINGKTEYSYNLNMVNTLSEKITKQHGVMAEKVSINENKITLAERPNRYIKSDLFVSIHHDSIPTVLNPMRDKLHGYSVFVSKKNPQYEKSLACAKIVAKNLKAMGREPSTYHGWAIMGESKKLLDKNGVYQYDNLVVLKSAKMPALLIEIGVIANPKEAEELTQQKVVDEIADNIARSLSACLEK